MLLTSRHVVTLIIMNKILCSSSSGLLTILSTLRLVRHELMQVMCVFEIEFHGTGVNSSGFINEFQVNRYIKCVID